MGVQTYINYLNKKQMRNKTLTLSLNLTLALNFEF